MEVPQIKHQVVALFPKEVLDFLCLHVLLGGQLGVAHLLRSSLDCSKYPSSMWMYVVHTMIRMTTFLWLEDHYIIVGKGAEVDGHHYLKKRTDPGHDNCIQSAKGQNKLASLSRLMIIHCFNSSSFINKLNPEFYFVLISKQCNQSHSALIRWFLSASIRSISQDLFFG